MSRDSKHEPQQIDSVSLFLFLIPPVNLVNHLPPPAVPSSPFPCIHAIIFSCLKTEISVFLCFNDPPSHTSNSEHSNISHQMFVLVNCSCCLLVQCALSMFVSLSVCLVLSFLQSLRGNLLGIAPLLSSPLPGCCCRLYSVTTVCTQPGAPSNATSLTYTPHGSPNGACVH